MKANIYLNAVLTVIALCLIVITIKAVPLISTAKAEGSTHCTGTLIANMNGGTTADFGGYNVDVSCD